MAGELVNVTPENVLQARAVILAEAQSFMEHLMVNFRNSKQLIGLCGSDPISRDAQDLFAEKLSKDAVEPAQQYVQRLQSVAEELANTARSFGMTEHRIESSFTRGADRGART